MASERVQRRIDRLLDQAEEAMDSFNWDSVRDCAQAVLGLDSENADALAFLDSADRVLRNQPSGGTHEIQSTTPTAQTPDQPTSFANDRYQVKRLLAEGGKNPGVPGMGLAASRADIG